MSCFANILPHRVVFRLWDCLLWEGNIALIRAGIALLRAKSQRLKLCDDSMSIYMELRDISPHIEVIMGGLNRSLSSTLHVDEHHISPDAEDSNSGMVTPSPMKSLSMLMGNTR